VKIKYILKSSVAAAALFALAAPVANAANENVMSSKNSSLTVSGQVVRSIFHADDGHDEAMFHAGGKVTSSRVRWIASSKFNQNINVGAKIEMNIPLGNAQGSMTLTGGQSGDGAGDGTTNTNAWGIRQEYIWVKHKKFGSIRMGHTDGASNGTAEKNMVGISNEDSNGTTNGTGITFINTTGAAGAETVGAAITAVNNNHDGASRQDVLRYDTPKFNGFSAAVATMGDANWDVGLGYSGKFGPLAVVWAAGYYDRHTGSTTVQYDLATSGGIKHDSGLNASFSLGKRQYKGHGAGEDTSRAAVAHEAGSAGGATWSRWASDSAYFSIGYQAKIFSLGGTNFSVSHQSTDNYSKNADEFEAVTLSAEQSFSSIGAKVMIQYSTMELEQYSAGVKQTFSDIDTLTLQTIFAF